MTVSSVKDYVTPTSLAAAIRILREGNGRATVVAGGVFVQQLIDMGLLSGTDTLVDLSRLGLEGVRVGNRRVRIGAMTTLTDLVGCQRLSERRCGALWDAVSNFLPDQVRNVATIGGQVCSAFPSFDLPVALLALEAELEAVGPAGRRKIPLDQFYQDYFSTVLQVGEIVEAVTIPANGERSSSASTHFKRTATDIPLVNVATKLVFDAGECIRAIIALGGVAKTCVRLIEAERSLANKKLTDDVLEGAAGKCVSLDPPDSPVVPSNYKRELARVLVLRSLRKTMNRAGDRLKS